MDEEYRRTYRDTVVSIAEAASDPETVEYDGVIERVLFENCRIVGPAVLLVDGTDMIDNHIAGELRALLWPLPEAGPDAVGGILVRDCRFVGCRFFKIGFSGGPHFMEGMRRGSLPS